VVSPVTWRHGQGVVNNSWRGEDCCWVVDREAEVRPATSQAAPSSTTFSHLSNESGLSSFGSVGCSWANGAWPTTKRGAVQQRPQPTGIIDQSPCPVGRLGVGATSFDKLWPDLCRRRAATASRDKAIGSWVIPRGRCARVGHGGGVNGLVGWAPGRRLSRWPMPGPRTVRSARLCHVSPESVVLN